MKLNNMTKSDRAKLYNKLYKRLRKVYSGGRAFGLDWTTMLMLSPQITGVMRQIAITDKY